MVLGNREYTKNISEHQLYFISTESAVNKIHYSNPKFVVTNQKVNKKT